MPRPLDGRIAPVTGASRGIGRRAALELAGAGAPMIVLARTKGGLEALDAAIWSEGIGSRPSIPGRSARESALLFCLTCRAKPAQPVERSLENERRRHPIDDSSALGTGDVLRD